MPIVAPIFLLVFGITGAVLSFVYARKEPDKRKLMTQAGGLCTILSVCIVIYFLFIAFRR